MLSSLSSRISSRRLLQLNNVCRRKITTAPSTIAAPSCYRPTSFLPTKITLRPISHTSSIQAQITVNVPTMGDSITEGTIVEWCVEPGSHVREGDVLALIETDKVTIDIKADQEGILVKQLGEVEAEVEVGTGLYVLDTDVENAESVAPVVEKTDDVAEVNDSLDAETMVVAEEASEKSSSASTSARVPSIHFLGKEGWKERRAATEDSPAAASSTTTTILTSNKPNAPTSITNIPYSSMYGRPPITDEEIDALMLGGADEAPEVRKVDSENGFSVVFLGGKIATAGPRGVWLAK
mmetsp:Transcript_33626/g.59044  ORF Transcript_33626/g.59044 Transcript_33626/m.59044 type:complete len:295 (-) Transcript_33626:274-1158(-)